MLNAFIMCYYHLGTTLVLFLLLTTISYYYSSYGCVQDLTIGVNAIIILLENNLSLRGPRAKSAHRPRAGFHGGTEGPTLVQKILLTTLVITSSSFAKAVLYRLSQFLSLSNSLLRHHYHISYSHRGTFHTRLKKG